MAECTPQPQSEKLYLLHSTIEINGTSIHILKRNDICSHAEDEIQRYDTVMFCAGMGTVFGEVILIGDKKTVQEKFELLQELETRIEDNECDEDCLEGFLEDEKYYNTEGGGSERPKIELEQISGAVAHKPYVTEITKKGVKYIQFGLNKTVISFKDYQNIKWINANKATRSLLDCCFDRATIAKSSLTGKLSPASKNPRIIKKQLNPVIVADIIELVMQTFKVTQRVVHTSITTKCADETKLLDIRLSKKQKTKGKE